MVTKRQFMAGAASTAALAGVARWRSALSTDRLGLAADDLVVFNGRYTDARRFATALAAGGIHAVPINGDAGTLWYEVLGPMLACGRHRLAGMGTSMDQFILETLSRAAGLRVRFQAHHDCRGRSTLTHSIRAHSGSTQIARAVELAGDAWPVALGTALLSAALPAGRPDTHTHLNTAVAKEPDHPGMLLSWILA